MPRSKNAVASRARRKKILDQAKGFYGKRKNVYTVAKNIVEKGLTYSYVGRKLKKREYRQLWIARINAAVRNEGLTYSQFMNRLSVKGIDLNRKVLADLAMNEPASFKAPWSGFFVRRYNHMSYFYILKTNLG
jgi:large subunit ribosomal protein L20